MGSIYQGVPYPIVSMIRETFKISTFIETGTHFGNSANWAGKQFREVITIERSPELWGKAVEKYGRLKNIRFIQGDSSEKLREILPGIRSETLFWLDAHWSGGETFGENDQCPLIRELEEINSHDLDHFVIIDDARLFLSPPPYPHSATQWPDLVSVLEALEPTNRERFIVIVDDVIIAVPRYAQPVIVKYCQERNTAEWKRNTIQQDSLFKSLKGCLYRQLRR